ncbi:MAG TPA: hypothetical protein VMB27_04615, partial [Solirubrobacteraceae bacterium]|nr:hypothetical protein [Solirubrobacteraceae bacterium]
VPTERIEPLPAAADTGLGDEIAAVGERLIVLIDAERALGGLLPTPRVRRSRTTTDRQNPPSRARRKQSET